MTNLPHVFRSSLLVGFFFALDKATLMLTTSALRRLPASSNDVRVRVEFSKNRLMTVLPRSVGAFLSGRRFISQKALAESSTCRARCASRPRIPS